MGKSKMRFSDLKINSKLALLIGVFLLSLVAMGAITIFMFRSSQTLTMMMSEQRIFSVKFYLGVEEFHEYIYSNDETDLEDSQKSFSEAIEIANTFATIDSIMETMPEKEWAPLLYNVFKEGLDYDIDRVKMMGKQILLLNKINKARLTEVQETAINAYTLAEKIKLAMSDYAAEKTPLKLELMDGYFEEIKAISHNFASKIYDLNDYVIRALILSIVLFMVVLITGLLLISIRISQSISSPIKILVSNFKNIAEGNLESSVKIESQNEIGELSTAFMEIQQGLQDVIDYTIKVAKGDYQVRLEPKSNKDELTIALNQMTKRLQEAQKVTQKENWLQD
ncbi:MAG TPA: HAMP domain-containing protein, partial [Prolixibacteraceae bacterium]|nr:HAMP domain-containing protein [Prolixibacteraceae bacterium]